MPDLFDGQTVEFKGSAAKPYLLASSAEFVGEFWFGEGSECVI
jgi:hypothetical protein